MGEYEFATYWHILTCGAGGDGGAGRGEVGSLRGADEGAVKECDGHGARADEVRRGEGTHASQLPRGRAAAGARKATATATPTDDNAPPT